MAAGRHGGCAVHEVRDVELHTRVAKRGGLRYFKGEYGRDVDHKRESACDVNRQKSERDTRDDEDGYRRKNGFVTGKRDREPGELSSDSDCNDPDMSDSGFGIHDNSSSEIAAKTVVRGKKKKISPVIWDREEMQVSKPLENKTDASGTIEVVCSSCDQSIINNYVPSPAKPLVIPGAAGSALAELPVGMSPTLSLGQQLGTEMGPGQPEEEECMHTRNISTSRWDEVNDLSGNESELTDEEGEFKRSKKTQMDRLLEINQKTKKLSSQELGELSGGASQGAQPQSSGSQGGHCSASVIGYECQDVVLNGHDSIEVVEEYSSSLSTHHVDGDSETQSSNSSPNQVGPLPKGRNMLQGCRVVVEFEKLNRINEGTYGVVFRAKDRKTGEIVAMKKLKMEKETEGFPVTSLREINILLSLYHPSIINVKEVVVGSRLDDIFMVMEYMEHDLKVFMETMKQPFSQSEVKCLMIQLIEGVKYLHDNWVLHRDLKTSNILLNNCGELKICDFGLARQYGSPLKPYTQMVVTLWYRAPELLLGAKKYSTAVDMWSLGCIMAEMLGSKPLFDGRSEQDQIYKMYEILGMPNEKIWPGCTKLPNYRAGSVKQQYNKLRERFPPTSFSGRPTLSVAGFDLLNKLLTYDPEKRITAEAALNHEWFREVPLPKSKEFMPTFPAQHVQNRQL